MPSEEVKEVKPRFHSSSTKTRLPPFPNCWFHLAPFSEFKDGEIVRNHLGA